ncbi:MAG: endolytic transglycosylase MltG [Bacteroidota bacterium]
MFKKLVFLFLLAIISFSVFAWVNLSKPLPISEDQEVRIPYNSTLNGAVNILKEKGMLGSPFLFKWTARAYSELNGVKVHAGAYKFSHKQTHFELIKSLFSGKQAFTARVTFPEGISLKEFASLVQKRVETDSAEFMRYATSDSLCRAHGIPAKNVEGYLMPDTYEFFWKEPAKNIVNKLLAAQNALWEKSFKAEAAEKNLSRHRVLTLAAIVESETPVAAESPRVAGVYQNRLLKGMKLDADPTVQYALGGVKRRLLYKDLEVDSPYNTYRFTGLPPGPINSPGAKAIAAALNPEKHRYIYFVAKPDGSGEHIFSENFAQHNKAVAEYRKAKRGQ